MLAPMRVLLAAFRLQVRPMNKPAELKLDTVPVWINGKPVAPSGRYGDVFNPATGQVTKRVVYADAALVDSAVKAATAALPEWRDTPPLRRARVMQKFLQLLQREQKALARIVTEEHGKTLPDAIGSVQRGIEVVEFACGIPHLLKGEYAENVGTNVDCWSLRQPLGVVAGITPFNFPVMVPMWMYPVAIACGNAFIRKPSERDPSVSLRVAELWQQAGLPDGVFNVVHGDKEAVDTILDAPEIAAVSFVGSTPIARYIHQRASSNGKRVQALGGAKNHAIVLPDADVDFAADHLAAAAFGSAGERCMAISATVAVGAAADPVVKAVSARAEAVKVGNGRDAGSEMGPVITRQAQERITRLIGSGQEQGARLAVDGRGIRVAGHEQGFFVGPTVVDEVRPEMDVYREEVFGPVLSVLRADTVEDAIALINANPYGNGTPIFTNSGEAARRFQRGVKVGMIGINVPVPVPLAFYSFGGWKDSLFGDKHVHGPEGVSFYTRAKVVTARWPHVEHPAGASLSFTTSV